MFCQNCGIQVIGKDKFCVNCGNSLVIRVDGLHLDQWWTRSVRVLYIALHIPLLVIIPVVWSANSTTYKGYYLGQYQYEDSYGDAFWYSLLALVIYIGIVRLIKLTFLYIVFAKNPQWKQELKKLF
jgi:hypothetical protein